MSVSQCIINPQPTEPEPTEIDIDIVGSGEIPDEVVGVGKSVYY